MSRKIYTDALTRLTKGTDAVLYRLIPKRVEVVRSEEELIEALAACAAVGEPVTFYGDLIAECGCICIEEHLVTGTVAEYITCGEADGSHAAGCRSVGVLGDGCLGGRYGSVGGAAAAGNLNEVEVEPEHVGDVIVTERNLNGLTCICADVYAALLHL